MALLSWFDDPIFYRPSRYQLQFWRDPEEYIRACLPQDLLRQPLEELRNLHSVLQDTDASVSSNKDKFEAHVDVQQFNPEEISVKVTGDNSITVEAKHEEKQDEHGYISRHFIRRYVLPDNCDIKRVQSKLSSDGVLTIMAPKVGENKKIEEREIPIIQTRQPLKQVEEKATPEEAKK